jgi:hypothetical protein
LPAFKARILGGVDQAAAVKAAETGQEVSPDQLAEAHAMIELLSVLPHSTQAQILTDRTGVWCSLASESLVGLSTDLVLKHGSHVPGEWSALGVLDAQPDFGSNPSNPTTLSGVEQAIVGVAGTLVGATIAQLAPITRNLLGRPRGAFGMTPLVIYRKVSG